MKKELTKEDIVGVFAMYYGQNIVVRNEGGKGSPVHNALSLLVLGMFEIKNHKLLLTPLEKVSDEHATEVGGCVNSFMSHSYKLAYGKEITKSLTGYSSKSLTTKEISFAYQSLIKNGYAVPLYFGLDHWANGKTAIELGIAIDKTTLPH